MTPEQIRNWFHEMDMSSVIDDATYEAVAEYFGFQGYRTDDWDDPRDVRRLQDIAVTAVRVIQAIRDGKLLITDEQRKPYDEETAWKARIDADFRARQSQQS